MKVSDYIAELLSNYTDCVFSGQGGNVVHIADSIYRNDNLKLIPCETEQGAAISADGYARISKQLGVTISTTAPGFANAFQGIQCSHFDNIPTLHIIGVPPVSHLKSTHGLNVKQYGFQELDIVTSARCITKYAVRITNPEMIRYELERLIHIAFEDRKGAVLMELPDDIQRAEIDPEKLAGYNPKIKDNKEYNIDWDIIENAIIESEKPLLILGGGISNSNMEMEAISFAEGIVDIPFLTSWACKDIGKYDSIYNCGTFGVSSTIYGNKILNEADLLIVLGCKLDKHMAGSDFNNFAKNAKKIIVVDIDKNEIEKFDDDRIIGIHCDLDYFFHNIPLEYSILGKNKWFEQIDVLKKQYPICKSEYREQKEYVNPYVFHDILSKYIDDAIIVTDAGATVTQTFQGLNMNGRAILFTSYNISPMGYALPAAIGAYFADNSRQTICIIGDGGIRMNIQELSLIKYHNIPIKIFVMDNGGYNIIRQTQDTWLNGRHVGTDETCGLPMPNIRKIAEAYGLDTMEVKYNENLDEIFNKILKIYVKDSILCIVKINPEQQIIPKLKFGQSLD